MEKRKPHYDLSAVQSAVRLRGADAFTATALIGVQAMGLEIAGIAYVKVTLRQDGSIVIQFKEK